MRDRQTYTVFGYWADTNERFGQAYDAAGARDAEDQALRDARADDGDLRIAGTLVGEHDAVDRYTAYVDPNDKANDERADLEDFADLDEVVEWTVIGLALRHCPERPEQDEDDETEDEAWNRATGGERRVIHEMAYNPKIAEDLARARVLEESGLELQVCTVLADTKFRCESFAFADHDCKER